jgi:hypothetical protein
MQATYKLALCVGLISASLAPVVFAADDNLVDAMAKASWRHDIAQTATPSDGCYHAAYPSMVWQSIVCKAATPHAHALPKPLSFAQTQTVGSGNDYVLNSANNLISQAVGSFPTYTGVTSLKTVGPGGVSEANEYSLQMNTGIYTTAACAGHSGCTVWQQFIYETDAVDGDEGGVFMQDWLLGYGSASCPGSFVSDGAGDCYKNSTAASLANIKPKSLGDATLTGTATTGGNDTAVLTYDGDAYSSSQKDSALDIASVWNDVEYNVFGAGSGTEAEFNSSGVSITVNVAVDDGSTAAPSCVADGGSTGNTNNLKLGSCTAVGGSTPSISFTESD